MLKLQRETSHLNFDIFEISELSSGIWLLNILVLEEAYLCQAQYK